MCLPIQCTDAIAESITCVTASGCETSVRCEPPLNRVTCECARLAMLDSESGVMTWSPLLMKYQDGMSFHAAFLDGANNAPATAARWLAQARVARSGGRSLPKCWRKMSFFR